MTAIEHRELKGITIKNLVVTIMGTASIVASVVTTYFGLRSEIEGIRISQQTEERINNMRIKVLEDEMVLLQREVDEIKFSKVLPPVSKQPCEINLPFAANFSKHLNRPVAPHQSVKSNQNR